MIIPPPIMSQSHSSLADFDVQQQIGKGTFGVVYKCKRKKDGGIYVLKELQLKDASQDEVQAAINECHLLASVDSDFVVKYFDSFIDNTTQTLWLVMEYAAHGTLRDYITKQKDYVTEADAWYFITQMIIGIASLHSMHIIHRDIKSLNIFVTEGQNGQKYGLKIGDMGVSKQLNSTTFMSQTLVGSPYYLSPEICKSDKYNIKSDIWALGVTFYEMMNKGKHPFLAQSQAALLINIIKGKYKPLAPVYSTQLVDLVRWCLQQDPSKRPDVFSLLAITPIQATIQKYNMVLPKSVSEGAREALQRLQRIKSSEISRSRMQQERSINQSNTESQNTSQQRSVVSTTQQRPVQAQQNITPISMPVIQQKQVAKNDPEINIESDIVIVDTEDIHEFQDDFDDDEDDTTPQKVVSKPKNAGARPDTSIAKQKLTQLLNDDQYMSVRFEDCMKEINSYQLQISVKDELLKFFIDNITPNEQQITEYVFKRIPQNKISIIQYLKQYSTIIRQRLKLNNEINKIMSEISE